MDDPLIGKTIGQYEIIEKIASGGMATVYRARQESIKRDVAVKVLTSQLMEDPLFIQRFRREVQVIARLEHPRILPVFDYGEIDGRPYLVMPYLTGGTLADRIRDAGGWMTLEEIAQILDQIAEGLDHAHNEGVIHRDLKPSNVLLGRHGNVHLSDFGIAKLSQESQQLTGDRMIGTLSYMAPEMFVRQPLTSAIDIYALGVTLFEMLTGTVPYEGDTAQVIAGHLHQPIPDVSHKRPGLPWAIRQVIAKAMSKNPVERYPTASALAQAFHQAIQGQPVAQGTASDVDTVQDRPIGATTGYGAAPPYGEAGAGHFPPPGGPPTYGSGYAPQYGEPPRARRRGVNWPLITFAIIGLGILVLACAFIAFLLFAPKEPVRLADLGGGGQSSRLNDNQDGGDNTSHEGQNGSGAVTQPEPATLPPLPTYTPYPTYTPMPEVPTHPPEATAPRSDEEAITQAVLDFDEGMRLLLETGDSSLIYQAAAGEALQDRLYAADVLASAGGCHWDYDHRGLRVYSIEAWGSVDYRVLATVDRDGTVMCPDGERPEYAFEGPYDALYIVSPHETRDWIVTNYCPYNDCPEELTGER